MQHKGTWKHTRTQYVSDHITVTITAHHILNASKTGQFEDPWQGRESHDLKDPQSPWQGYIEFNRISQIWQFQPNHNTLSQAITISPFPVFISWEHINQNLALGTPLRRLYTHVSPTWPPCLLSLPQRFSVKYPYVTSDT